ncbi:hydroxyacid dehydrogenase [Candidatus Parcubacteria bacterium]|nr:hydroxyacid dehydrogenase [Candidatus Parcubacteria bacterium]
MKHKILCTIGKKYTKEAKKILETIGEVDCHDLTQGELIEKISGYSILLVGLGLKVDKQVLDNAKELKIIATATTGLDHIDVDYAKSKNIDIISLRGENEFLNTITGTAELAFGLIIGLLRLTHPAFESVKNYQWDRESHRGHSLCGKTLGIVGLGRLGKMMAKYGNAFGIKVIACDPHQDIKTFQGLNCEKADFDDLLKNSDIISIHIHLKEDTENMFNHEAFEKMKYTAYLINTSRGKIVNENDLLDALKNKKIAGYATDVLAGELDFDKNFNNYPLVEYARKNNNLIIVPHIGGMTHESREATDIFIANKIKKFLQAYLIPIKNPRVQINQ